MSAFKSARSRGTKALQNIEVGIARGGRTKLPPVEQWVPHNCGYIGLCIADDGPWHYLESPFRRMRLVKLFASGLRRERGGEYYLATPVEKIRIDVDDAPILAVEIKITGSGAGQGLATRTNDEWVDGDAGHPMRFFAESRGRGLKPYLRVRGCVEARLTRALAYDLVELAITGKIAGIDTFEFWNHGTFFAIAPTNGLGTV